MVMELPLKLSTWSKEILSPSTLPFVMSVSPRGVVTLPVSVEPSTWKSKTRVCMPLRPCTWPFHLPLKSAASAATEPSAKNKTVSPNLRIMRIPSPLAKRPRRRAENTGTCDEGRADARISLRERDEEACDCRCEFPGQRGLSDRGGLLDQRGAMDGLDLPAVAAAQRVPADDGNILEHANAVFEIADPRALVVGPAYGDFLNAVAALEGDEENLRIE